MQISPHVGEQGPSLPLTFPRALCLVLSRGHWEGTTDFGALSPPPCQLLRWAHTGAFPSHLPRALLPGVARSPLFLGLVMLYLPQGAEAPSLFWGTQLGLSGERGFYLGKLHLQSQLLPSCLLASLLAHSSE